MTPKRPAAGRVTDGRPPLAPEAGRALEEARRRRAAQSPAVRPRETGGRNGPEPVRYGDWESKGRAVDF